MPLSRATAADATTITSTLQAWQQAAPDLYGTATYESAPADIRDGCYLYRDSSNILRGIVVGYPLNVAFPDQGVRADAAWLALVAVDPSVFAGGVTVANVMNALKATVAANFPAIVWLVGEVPSNGRFFQYAVNRGYRIVSNDGVNAVVARRVDGTDGSG